MRHTPSAYTRHVSTLRDQLRELVERLPDEQVPAAVSDLKARLTAVGREPPAWFAVAEGSASDLSESVEEILAYLRLGPQAAVAAVEGRARKPAEGEPISDR